MSPARSKEKPAAQASAEDALQELLSESGVCVVAGPGGVGKTTTAAAIGLAMARRGSRVAVVTIDPAKRLAQALGLDRLGNDPHRVDADHLAGAGIEGEGELWAMTLDSQRTFDDLITRIAPDASSRDRLLNNRIYKEISGAVAGAQEFGAVAKLHELEQEGRFDLIVLDTPPSRNALDFLDAPRRITGFFDGRAMQVVMRPAGFGLRLAGAGTGLLLGMLKRVTGAGLFTDLAEFFAAMSSMTDGFRERARGSAAILAADDTSFVLVTSAHRPAIAETAHLHSRLKESGMHPRAVIVNRVHPPVRISPKKLRSKDARTALGDGLSGRLAELAHQAKAAADRDAEGLREIAIQVPVELLVTVSLLDGEVHDVPGLVRIEQALFG
jgi:anion-transporting  ArsA/GET3 family ATPase